MDLLALLFVCCTGFAFIFKTRSVYLVVLSLPATYATAFGFMYGYGKLIAALASSNLLPPGASELACIRARPS